MNKTIKIIILCLLTVIAVATVVAHSKTREKTAPLDSQEYSYIIENKTWTMYFDEPIIVEDLKTFSVYRQLNHGALAHSSTMRPDANGCVAYEGPDVYLNNDITYDPFCYCAYKEEPLAVGQRIQIPDEWQMVIRGIKRTREPDGSLKNYYFFDKDTRQMGKARADELQHFMDSLTKATR